MPTSQDAGIEEAFGRPLAELYAQAAAGTAVPGVQQVLELRSFLAVVEDQAAKARDRIHQATGPAADPQAVPLADLRFRTDLLEAALEVGAKYRRALQDLVRTGPGRSSPAPRRPVQFDQSKIAEVFGPGGGVTAQRPAPAPPLTSPRVSRPCGASRSPSSSSRPRPTMLAALLKLRSDTDLAERHITALRDRIHQLTQPGQAIGELTFTARHLLDAAQRLSVAVTARNAHLAAATAVLDGLRRRETPPAEAPPAALPTQPAQAHALPVR